MKLTNMPEGVADWPRMPAIRMPGAFGAISARTHQVGEVQLRILEYSPGYLADHWCSKGHIIYVITGTLIIEHQNDRPACALSAGMSWYVADDVGSPHRVRSDNGAMVFILD
jgi:hypothetical protein